MAHGFPSQGLAQELQGLAARQASAGGQAKEGLAFYAQLPCPAEFRRDRSGRPGGRLSTTSRITGPCVASALALTLRPLGSARAQSGQMVHSGQGWGRVRLRQMLLPT